MARKNGRTADAAVTGTVVTAKQSFVDALTGSMTTSAEQISSIQGQIASLNEQLTVQVGTLRQHQAELATLGVEMPDLPKAVLALVSETEEAPVRRGRGRPRGSKNRPASGKRPHNESSLVEALQSVLRGKQMSIEDAMNAVTAAGYKTSAENFRVIVSQALINKKNFKRVARGIYTAK